PFQLSAICIAVVVLSPIAWPNWVLFGLPATVFGVARLLRRPAWRLRRRAIRTQVAATLFVNTINSFFGNRGGLLLGLLMSFWVFLKAGESEPEGAPEATPIAGTAPSPLGSVPG